MRGLRSENIALLALLNFCKELPAAPKFSPLARLRERIRVLVHRHSTLSMGKMYSLVGAALTLQSAASSAEKRRLLAALAM